LLPNFLAMFLDKTCALWEKLLNAVSGTWHGNPVSL